MTDEEYVPPPDWLDGVPAYKPTPISQDRDTNTEVSPTPPSVPQPPQAVGGIQVTVNVAWINSLRQDRKGNVTFFVDII